MWPWIGPIISGMALTWGIYSFMVKRMEEKRDREAKLVQIAQDLKEKELLGRIEDLKRTVNEQDKAFTNLRLTVHSLTQQVRGQGEIFNATSLRMEKVLDRHEQKLDDFGKVIIK